jgi:hypothetical protein
MKKMLSQRASREQKDEATRDYNGKPSIAH